MATWTTRTSPTTTWTTRPSIEVTDAINPIITGLWDDSATWSESLKFWRDNGNATGTTWNTRILPV